MLQIMDNLQAAKIALKKGPLGIIDMIQLGKICRYEIDICSGTTQSAVQFMATLTLSLPN
jgi:hypothetical protein